MRGAEEMDLVNDLYFLSSPWEVFYSKTGENRGGGLLLLKRKDTAGLSYCLRLCYLTMSPRQGERFVCCFQTTGVSM